MVANMTQNTAKTDTPDVLTVPEVAARLRVTPATIRNWIAQGTIVALQNGRHYRIPRRELDRLLTPRSAR